MAMCEGSSPAVHGEPTSTRILSQGRNVSGKSVRDLVNKFDQAAGKTPSPAGQTKHSSPTQEFNRQRKNEEVKGVMQETSANLVGAVRNKWVRPGTSHAVKPVPAIEHNNKDRTLRQYKSHMDIRPLRRFAGEDHEHVEGKNSQPERSSSSVAKEGIAAHGSPGNGSCSISPGPVTFTAEEELRQLGRRVNQYQLEQYFAALPAQPAQDAEALSKGRDAVDVAAF